MTAYADLVELARRATAGEVSLARDDRWNVAIDPAVARKAAVLLLFGVLDSVPARSDKPLAPADLDVLLVERAATLTDHPGQVAFPGGGVDPEDASVDATALREAREETGLDPAGVQILGRMPEVSLPVSNFEVTPVLAWWASPSPVDVVDYGESAQVFRVPVRDLLDPDNRYTATLTRGGQTYASPAFLVNGVLVWGFTAGILNRVFDHLGWSVPWDSRREIPAPL
ncbi:NUDIX hydrolase [Arthrobacter sp. 35W]|uniref:NUDIX hydrolase n=1 Tax=Arthrobacter sp. 35W TaxID=1132441 RepID=UPI00040B919E|nr:CoA pyrophosphatase [Arthrobacter sp. 35W]